MGKTPSKPFAARHGRGTAWAQHAMCESALRPKQVGQLSYTRIAQEGIWMAIVGEGYPGIHISRQNIVDIQRAICQLVDELPEE